MRDDKTENLKQIIEKLKVDENLDFDIRDFGKEYRDLKSRWERILYQEYGRDIIETVEDRVSRRVSPDILDLVSYLHFIEDEDIEDLV